MRRGVYFVEAVESKRIKIGFAHDVDVRVKLLQTGSPERLRVLAVIHSAPASHERELHERFADARLHGEWFAPADALLAFIRHVLNPAPADKVPVVQGTLTASGTRISVVCPYCLREHFHGAAAGGHRLSHCTGEFGQSRGYSIVLVLNDITQSQRDGLNASRRAP